MSFLDNGGADAGFDTFATGGARRWTRLLHAGVIFDDAIVRIRTFVIETRIEAATDWTTVDVLLQAVRTMNVALSDNRARPRFANADALFVGFKSIGVTFATTVNEWITISMQRVKIPQDVGLGTRSVIDGRLTLVFVKLTRRFGSVTRRLTII